MLAGGVAAQARELASDPRLPPPEAAAARLRLVAALRREGERLARGGGLHVTLRVCVRVHAWVCCAPAY